MELVYPQAVGGLRPRATLNTVFGPVMVASLDGSDVFVTSPGKPLVVDKMKVKVVATIPLSDDTPEPLSANVFRALGFDWRRPNARRCRLVSDELLRVVGAWAEDNPHLLRFSCALSLHEQARYCDLLAKRDLDNADRLRGEAARFRAQQAAIEAGLPEELTEGTMPVTELMHTDKMRAWLDGEFDDERT